MLDGVRRSAQHAEWLVAHLVPVAVRAMQQVSSPALTDAADIGQVPYASSGSRAVQLQPDLGGGDHGLGPGPGSELGEHVRHVVPHRLHADP